MTDACMIDHPNGYEGRCCCNCRWHAEDHSHPNTDGGSCVSLRGFVCLAPEFSRTIEAPMLMLRVEKRVVYSGWPEHGLCEMHDSLEERR